MSEKGRYFQRLAFLCGILAIVLVAAPFIARLVRISGRVSQSDLYWCVGFAVIFLLASIFLWFKASPL